MIYDYIFEMFGSGLVATLGTWFVAFVLWMVFWTPFFILGKVLYRSFRWTNRDED